MPSYLYAGLLFTVGVPALIGILRYSRIPQSSRVIAILMIVGLITEVFLVWTAKSGKHNFYIVNIYGCIEVVLLTIFFSRIIYYKEIKWIMSILCSLVLIGTGVELILTDINKWGSFSSAAESAFIITLGLYYFYEAATGINPDPIPDTQNFWFTGIILFYFMSSLEYFLLNRYLLNINMKSWIMLGNVHAFVNAFCNLAYALVLWKFTR